MTNSLHKKQSSGSVVKGVAPDNAMFIQIKKLFFMQITHIL